jgi:hypothetical protein
MPPLIIRRAIGGLGCDYRLLGAARQLGRHTVAAAAVAVSWRSLTEARQRADIAQSILTLPALPQIQAA